MVTPGPQTFALTLAQPNIAIGDLSGDVAYDLVLQNAYFKANADGTFTDASSSLNTTAGEGDRVRLADMNADGLADRVLASHRTLWVEYNSASGSFSPGPSIQLDEDIGDFTVGYAPLNTRKAPQVIAGSRTKITFLDLETTGWSVTSVLPTALDVASMALGDMNNDGDSDLLWQNGTTRAVDIWLMNNNVEGWAW